MKRLRILILLFSIFLLVPAAYVVMRTYDSLTQEETAKWQFFADSLLNEIESFLAGFVRKEEMRAIDEYNHMYQPKGSSGKKPVRSPLSAPAQESYILGYFQNNPDGSFETPLVKNPDTPSEEFRRIVSELKEMNTLFNAVRRREGTQEYAGAGETAAWQNKPPRTRVEQKKEKKQVIGFADQYIRRKEKAPSKSRLGQEKERVEEITPMQAANVAQMESLEQRDRAWNGFQVRETEPRVLEQQRETSHQKRQTMQSPAASEPSGKTAAQRESVFPSPFSDEYKADESPGSEEVAEEGQVLHPGSFFAEVAPLQSVMLDPEKVFFFRRVVLHGSIYRQGFVIDINRFLQTILDRHFRDHPMAQYTKMELSVHSDSPRGRARIASQVMGANIAGYRIRLTRNFPRPFSFLTGQMSALSFPRSPGRKVLTLMVGIFSGVFLLGIFAIHQSVRTVYDMSERRSRFVSSVTHELKTPLTNIRMYIEMLEAGIAPTPERKKEYYRILRTESQRLSRLINNVLEFSKLEKKKLHLNYTMGDFEEVIDEAVTLLQEQMRKNGFTLNIRTSGVSMFAYDAEIMAQVLINLMENSMKFGKHADQKEITLTVDEKHPWIRIRISDTGPGIPKKHIKKIFDDFYRAEGGLTQRTRGTGIGLAFVRKVVRSMGGKVSACNNPEKGCTITICLPKNNLKVS